LPLAFYCCSCGNNKLASTDGFSRANLGEMNDYGDDDDGGGGDDKSFMKNKKMKSRCEILGFY